MGTCLFLSETRLEAWIAEGRAEIGEAKVRLVEEPAEFELASAVHIRALVEGRDEREWLGRVKTEAFLRDAGAEILGETMVVGETAYEIVPGFLLETEEELEETQAYLEEE